MTVNSHRAVRAKFAFTTYPASTLLFPQYHPAKLALSSESAGSWPSESAVFSSTLIVSGTEPWAEEYVTVCVGMLISVLHEAITNARARMHGSNAAQWHKLIFVCFIGQISFCCKFMPSLYMFTLALRDRVKIFFGFF